MPAIKIATTGNANVDDGELPAGGRLLPNSFLPNSFLSNRFRSNTCAPRTSGS